MKSTGCIKKDVKPAARYIKRKVTYPCGIKINNAIYFHQSLKKHLGVNVLVINGRDSLRVYDTRRRFICTAEKSIDLPKQERGIKCPDKKPYTMEIHESLERIRESKLCDMTLFELSIRALMPNDVFKELKGRIQRIQRMIESGNPKLALVVVNELLGSPQNRLKTGAEKTTGKLGGEKLWED
jgi:hypothetical protein